MQRGVSYPGKESSHSSDYVPIGSKPDGMPIAKPGRPRSTVNAPSVGFINGKSVLTKAVSINSSSVVYGNGISDTNSTPSPAFRVPTPARNGGPLPGRVEGQRRPPPASRSTSTSTSGMCSDSTGSGSEEGTTGAIRTRKVSAGAQSLHDMPLAAVLPSARLANSTPSRSSLRHPVGAGGEASRAEANGGTNGSSPLAQVPENEDGATGQRSGPDKPDGSASAPNGSSAGVMAEGSGKQQKSRFQKFVAPPHQSNSLTLEQREYNGIVDRIDAGTNQVYKQPDLFQFFSNYTLLRVFD